MARRIQVQLIGDDASLQRMFARSEAGAVALGGAFTKVSIGLGAIAKSFIVVEALGKVFEGLSASVHLGTEEFKENAQITAQTVAALKSTGDTAHVTAKQVDDLGQSLSNLSGVDDELIRAGENILLGFTKIQNFAGKGNDIFTQATQAALDFSVRSGRSVQAASVAIGRALQDPAKAAGSLRRAYVVLTAAEKEQIASAIHQGDTLKAQRDILADLARRYGGAAKAAGETLPGALGRLRDRLKDVSGELVGITTPALTKGAVALADFFEKIQNAQGGRAKLNVAVTGLEHLGDDLLHAIQHQFARIDFAQIGEVGERIIAAVKAKVEAIDWSRISSSLDKTARDLGHRVGERLRQIDWKHEIETVGQKIGSALVDALHELNTLVRQVDWQKVGSAIAKGIGLAIAAVVLFVHNLNLAKITHAVVDVIGAALLAAAGILEGIGKTIGEAILKGIEAGLKAAKNEIIKIADDIALKVIEPFTHLPFGIGKPAQAAKKALKQQLDDMAKVATDGARKVSQALAPIVNPKPIGSRNFSAGFSADQVAAAAGGAGSTVPPPPAATGARSGLTAAQRNTFFDNAVARILLRGGLGSLQDQLAAIKKASGLITQRLAATKDVTRKLNLEDQVLQLAANAKQVREQIATQFIDSLNLNLARAQTTSTLTDDLSALKKIQAALQQQIHEFGKTSDLESQLLDVRQQIAQTVQRQRDQQQFFTLGLSPTGDARVPLVKTLQKQLANVSQAVRGTFLDTSKTRSVLANIKKVLSAGVGEVSSTVRAKIKEMLDGINQQLAKHAGDVTKFAHVNSNALLTGLGLSPDQIRVLRGRIAQIGPGGTIPHASGQFALAGAQSLTVQSDVYLDGQKLSRNVTSHQVKAGKRRTTSRRG